MSMEEEPVSPELKRAKNAEVITSCLVNWYESKSTDSPTLEGDFQFAAELLERAIYDFDSEYIPVVKANDAPVNTTSITGTFGDFLDITPSPKGPLVDGQKLPLTVFRKINSPRAGSYTYGKSNVFVGTHLQYIELGDLARGLAGGAELTYESPLREAVKQEWEAVAGPHIADDKKDIARTVIEEIMDKYSEKGRDHHNLTHILECFEQLEPYQNREDYLQLWLALLLHDETYDTHASDNEEVSAYNARMYMEALGLPGVDTVQRLILSTKDHVPEVEDEKLICSIDMWILASSTERYDRYARAIRNEFAWVPEYVYIAERTKILKSFQEPLTHPDFVGLNDRVLANVAREIAQLN